MQRSDRQKGTEDAKTRKNSYCKGPETGISFIYLRYKKDSGVDVVEGREEGKI